MKKLNKLLLMGAALSGALVTKAGAYVDIKVNDIADDFKKSGNEAKYNEIVDEINDNYAVKLDNFEWQDAKYDRDRYYMLKGLEKYLKIPIIENNLEKYKKETGNKFTIKFKTNSKKDEENLRGETSWTAITIYGPALIGKNIVIPGNKRYTNMWHKLALQNIINNPWNVPEENIDVYSIQSNLVHELGHFVSNVEEAKENKQNGKKFDCDDDDNQRWLRKFYVEYCNDLKNNDQIKKYPWDDLLESEYGNTKLEDWFAESFCRAVFPGDHMGGSDVSKQFEQTLSRLSGIKDCLTP